MNTRFTQLITLLAALALIVAACEVSDGPWVLDAQAHLSDWYGRFGFVAEGDEFLEDGIPHVTMRKAA